MHDTVPQEEYDRLVESAATTRRNAYATIRRLNREKRSAIATIAQLEDDKRELQQAFRYALFRASGLAARLSLANSELDAWEAGEHERQMS